MKNHRRHKTVITRKNLKQRKVKGKKKTTSHFKMVMKDQIVREL
jgi:hypothetical protein